MFLEGSLSRYYAASDVGGKRLSLPRKDFDQSKGGLVAFRLFAILY
jgi:hypothetical protein